MCLTRSFWDLKIFLASEIALLVEFIVLASIWATLLGYPPSKHRPLDNVFIHAPMTLLLVILWNVDIWQNGLLALNWYDVPRPFRSHALTVQRFKYIGSDAGVGHGKWEPEHQNHVGSNRRQDLLTVQAWIAFGVMTSVGLIDAFIVFLRCDPIWAAGSVYVFLSIILKVRQGLPAPSDAHRATSRRRSSSRSSCSAACRSLRLRRA